MAGYLNGMRELSRNGRLPLWDAWALVTILSAMGWVGLLAVLR